MNFSQLTTEDGYISLSTEADSYLNSTSTVGISGPNEFSFNFTNFQNQTNTTTATPNRYTYLTDVASTMKKFCTLTLFLVGICGNLLTVIILSLKRNRGTSTAMFLLFLAASDMMILFTSYFSEWMIVMWSFNFRDVNSALCKIHLFLTYFSLQFSSWILVLVTTERCISVINPAKVRIICNRRKGMWGLVGLAIFLALLNGHWLVGMVHKYNPYTTQYCAGSSESYIKFLNKVWPIIDFCVTFAIPCILIVVGNTIIILKIVQSSRSRSHMVASDKKKNTSSLTVTLIILNIMFIISMAPASIYLLTYYLTYESQDIEQITLGFFVYDMVNLLAGLNATVNFILYILSGSKFRQDVKSLFCCKQPHFHGGFGRSTKKMTK